MTHCFVIASFLIPSICLDMEKNTKSCWETASKVEEGQDRQTWWEAVGEVEEKQNGLTCQEVGYKLEEEEGTLTCWEATCKAEEMDGSSYLLMHQTYWLSEEQLCTSHITCAPSDESLWVPPLIQDGSLLQRYFAGLSHAAQHLS